MELSRIEGKRALKNDVMKVGGMGEGQVGQPQAGSVVLFTFTWLCSSQLDFTEHHLPLCRSETLYGLAFLFGDSVGLHWEGPHNEIRTVKDSSYYFYRKKLDSAFAILLVCPV